MFYPKPEKTWTYSVHAIASKLHFAMAMLIVRSWIGAPNSNSMFPVPLLL